MIILHSYVNVCCNCPQSIKSEAILTEVCLTPTLAALHYRRTGLTGQQKYWIKFPSGRHSSSSTIVLFFFVSSSFVDEVPVESKVMLHTT